MSFQSILRPLDGAGVLDAAARGVAGDWFEEYHPSKLFLAVRSGVYRHEVVGVFSRFDKALDAGIAAIEAEDDRYHGIDFLLLTLDVPTLFKVGPVAFSQSGPVFQERALGYLKWQEGVGAYTRRDKVAQGKGQWVWATDRGA